MPGVHCHIHDQTVGRSGVVSVGMTQDDNGINGTVAGSQYCPLNYCSKKGSNVTLTKPDSQCNYNHSGILCAACQPGLSLALGSERCLPCSNKYLAHTIYFGWTCTCVFYFVVRSHCLKVQYMDYYFIPTLSKSITIYFFHGDQLFSVCLHSMVQSGLRCGDMLF